MKLATLKLGGRDGTLIVVSRNLQYAVKVEEIAPNLQNALDNWSEKRKPLEEVYKKLNSGSVSNSFSLDFHSLASPLPRAYHWVDGSAYLNHVELVRKARGAEMPKEFLVDPLVYQGGSDAFIGPRDPICLESEAWGIDFESEVAVITDDVPMGISADYAEKHIQLLVLVNDVSLRNLIPGELAKGFGFYQSKPATAFSPIAVTPDELGDSWKNAKVHNPLHTYWNGKLVGQPNAGDDMQFSFAELLAHAAKTRELKAGSILGSGTVSNRNSALGYSCIQEKRMLEKIEKGEFLTNFMRFGDRVKIEMLNAKKENIFGAIEQEVVRYNNPYQAKSKGDE